MHEGLDVEAQCRTDAHDILAIQLLENCCLACVIETTDRDGSVRRQE